VQKSQLPASTAKQYKLQRTRKQTLAIYIYIYIYEKVQRKKIQK